MQDNDALTLHPDIMFRTIGDEGIVVDQRQPEVMVVNAQGIRIIELIRETGSRKTVLECLQDEFDAPMDELVHDFEQFLGQLREKDIVR